jgi:ubiquinone/menaquinone biosynthesis C-methylase UbiE
VNQKSVSAHSNAPDIETATKAYMDRFKGPVGDWLLSIQATGTRKLLPVAPSRILDVGGGHGQNIPTLQACGHQVTVLGSDESSSSLIRPFIDSGAVTFQSGSLVDMPFPENHFDVVISYRTVCHMDDLDTFVSELVRVVRNEVIIDFPSRASFNILYTVMFRLKKQIETNTREYHLFNQGEINQLFARHGFVQDGRFKQFFLPMALHRVIGVRILSVVMEKIFRFSGLTLLFGSPVLVRYRPGPGKAGGAID